jgi:hypothetical protein
MTEKNVLLLALSTFNKYKSYNATEAVYKGDKGDENYYYFYQMEPVLKVLEKKLGEKPLDNIVVLCTEETTKQTENENELKFTFSPSSESEYLKFGFETQEKYIDDVKKIYKVKSWKPEKSTDKGVTFDEGNISPADYFKKKFAINYVKNGEKSIEIIDLNDKDGNAETDAGDISTGISKATEFIRKLKKEADSEEAGLNLYVDNHGGFRGTALVMEAILSLLKNESIAVNTIYNVEFNNNISKITSNSPEFEIFDFVSGVNEFINYGRIESLNKFYEGKAVCKDTKKLLKIIRGISQSIQMCDVNGFEKNLNAMKDFQKKMKNNDECNKWKKEAKGDYLPLFNPSIKNDYAKLLEDDSSVVDEVEWCLNKGFYQQCLTLIEARMPDVIVKRFITLKKVNVNKVKKEKENVNSFVLKKVMNDPRLYFECESSADGKNVTYSRGYGIMYNLLEVCGTGQKLKNKIKGWTPYITLDKVKDIWTEYSIQDGKNQANNKKQKVAEMTKYIPLKFNCGQDDVLKENMYFVLVLHNALTRMRNISNHAGNYDNIKVENVKVAIETYVEIMKEILNPKGE